MSEPVQLLVERLHAKRSGDGWKAKCPVHDDRDPSLSIREGNDGRALIKCHAGCSTDDVLTAIGLTRRDLFPVTSHGQWGNGVTPTPTLDWQECVNKFSAEHLERLSEWRGYPGEFCSWIKQARLVGIVEHCIAFPVHENGKVVAAHVRARDGSWRYSPTGTKTRPLVIGELLPSDHVHIFESQWDAFAFMYVSGIRDGIIITRGASNGALVADLIPQAATVYVWPQNDAPGQKWAKDVCAHAEKSCTIKLAKSPAQYGDLNDWTRAGATSDGLLQGDGPCRNLAGS